MRVGGVFFARLMGLARLMGASCASFGLVVTSIPGLMIGLMILCVSNKYI